MKQPYISVVIPCFDEMANLQKGVLDHIVHFFEKKNYSYEIIVVDDGSKDGSSQFIANFSSENSHVRLLKRHHVGKAGAVTDGILQANGKFILFTDMDQATPIEELEKLLPYCKKDYDVVIGSRNKRRKGAPWTRLIISHGNIILRKLIVGLRHISDTQCGFKIFEHDAAKAIFKKIYDSHNGFKQITQSSVTSGFDVELLLIARKLDYRIKEVTVNWLYVETRRVSPLGDSIEGIKELVAIRLNQIKGKY